MTLFSALRSYRWYISGRWQIKNQIRKNSTNGKINIILGAGSTIYPEWIPTDLPHFNILKPNNWQYFFSAVPIDHLLAEHVLEHLTVEEVKQVIMFSSKYLNPGGCFRIAVPDGYHPDPAYTQLIAPPADGHLSIWNIDSLQKILIENGFHTNPLEYYTADGKFMTKDFDFVNGAVTRSKTKGFKSAVNADYSSLIIDSYKLN